MGSSKFIKQEIKMDYIICCGVAVKKMQTLAVNVRKRKVLTVIETMTLVKVDRT
jgi:hypothetical protein